MPDCQLAAPRLHPTEKALSSLWLWSTCCNRSQTGRQASGSRWLQQQGKLVPAEAKRLIRPANAPLQQLGEAA